MSIITIGLGSNALVTYGYGAVSGTVIRGVSVGLPPAYIAARARNQLIGSLNLPFQTYIVLRRAGEEEEQEKKKKKKNGKT